MMLLLALVSFLVIIAGVFLAIVCAERRSWLRVIFGVLLFVGGMVSAEIIAFRIERFKADLQHRTHTLIGSAVEVNKEGENTGKCVQFFKFRYREEKLDRRLPYTFEIGCNTGLFNGDVLRLVFVAPKNAAGNPEVLEILNLTYEIEVYYAPPSLLDMVKDR